VETDDEGHVPGTLEDFVLGEDVTHLAKSKRPYILLVSEDGCNFYRPDEPRIKTESSAARHDADSDADAGGIWG
jgi:hypothetical protein